ncbi:hypothetical protein Taro_001948 [Colocasia esculenta]|uniref:Uncharacterized protein n=1 Tax=Colocasia esculenta TaxID=4460 RepID=A0A843TKB5_COLES|nr:hypothetical protein [Colocasia esculenta]
MNEIPRNHRAFEEVHEGYLGDPMLSAPTAKACTCLPPAFFCRVTKLVTVFASGLVVRSSSGGDFGLSLLAWPGQFRKTT